MGNLVSRRITSTVVFVLAPRLARPAVHTKVAVDPGEGLLDLGIVNDSHAARCGIHGFYTNHQDASGHSPKFPFFSRHKRYSTPTGRSQ